MLPLARHPSRCVPAVQAPAFTSEELSAETPVRKAGWSAVILSGERGVLGGAARPGHSSHHRPGLVRDSHRTRFQQKRFVCLSYLFTQNSKGRDWAKFTVLTVAPRTFLTETGVSSLNFRG